MIVTPAPYIEAHYLRQTRLWLAGKVTLPEKKLGGRRTRTHLSDLQNCPLPAYYKRVLEEVPPISDISVLRFLRGRAIESVLGTEQSPVEADGIIGTVDDVYPIDKTIVEIKTSNENFELFDIATSHNDWRERMMGYCYMYNCNSIYLYVYFSSGNLLAYMYWAKSGMEKKFGKDWRKRVKYATIASRGYKLTFTDAELAANWEEHKIRKAVLEGCVQSRTPMPIEVVRATRPQWQCKLCELSDNVCYIKQGGKSAEHSEATRHSSSSPYKS